MRVLFDQGTPAPLRRRLANCAVETAGERGWSTLENGELLEAAEVAGFDAFLTTDSNLKYQQNLADRRIAIVVLSATSWPRIEKVAALIDDALSNVDSGSYVEIDIPY